jgi:flagellar biosynthesis protein FlhF
MDASFAFAPLPQAGPVRPAMLVGPPGTGKTIAVAKLATRLTRAGKTPTVITTDTRRAGGIDQLAAFTNILGLKLITSDDPDDLASAARAAGDNPVIIDSAGSNPFDVLEMETLAEQVRAAGAEPILVVSAGTDPMEAADIAHSFTALGAGRLLATRLDLSRRLGSVVAAAEATGLAFSEVSISPHVGDGLIALNPLSLARLILPDLRERPHHSPAFPVKEAAR